jgi:hypothetical protein
MPECRFIKFKSKCLYSRALTKVIYIHATISQSCDLGKNMNRYSSYPKGKEGSIYKLVIFLMIVLEKYNVKSQWRKFRRECHMVEGIFTLRKHDQEMSWINLQGNCRNKNLITKDFILSYCINITFFK